jgi:hypothetical protein
MNWPGGRPLSNTAYSLLFETGHFALETHGLEIVQHMRTFLRHRFG